MKRPKRTGKLAALIVVCVVILGTAFFVSGWAGVVVANFSNATDSLMPGSVSYSRNASTTMPEPAKPEAKPTVAHIPTPESVKAIYMSQCVVGTPSFRETLVKLIDETELNAVIIDIRDYTGGIAFPTEHPLLKDMVSDACGARDMKAFLEMLHEKRIYVIGRVTVFQNPLYTKMHPDQAVQKTGGGVWKDHKGLAFVDVSAKPYWETVVA
ncbi:MAG: putative glycoside hydrolase, partial [Minisyncoccia bacterium]